MQFSLNFIINNCGTDNYFTIFHMRFGQCLLKLQSQALTAELTPLRLIPSILIRQKYYTTHVYFC